MQVDDESTRALDPVDVAAPEPPPGRDGARRGHDRGYARVRAAARWSASPERAVVLMLGLLVLLVHDVGYLLQHPFWLDESWVAVTARFPLSALPSTTSATPIGWSLLLRVFTIAGDQTSRLLPLAFAGAAVVVAYWFARRLDWRRREASVVAGLLAGFGVLVVPAMLARNDLKQYTADACLALLALALTSRLERQWSRRGLLALSVCIWGGMLFSHTVAFVGVAAFGSLCLVQLVRRCRGRLVESLMAGAGTAVLMVGVYQIFDARSVGPGLTAYWESFYLPVGEGLRASVSFVTLRFDLLHVSLSLGPVWLAVGLVIAGLVTIFRLGRPATALTVIALAPEMLGAAALHKYPFLDLRTSTFLSVIMVVVAAIGIAGLYSLLRPWFRGVVAATVVAGVVVAFAFQVQPYLRQHTLPSENVRDQARYVATHAAPADVTVVNLGSSFGFAYYWPTGHPSRRPASAVLQGYEVSFPDQPRIVVARDRNDAAVDAAVTAARRLALQRHARIWLVRTHMSGVEWAAWNSALKQQGFTAKELGHDGLWVVQLE